MYDEFLCLHAELFIIQKGLSMMFGKKKKISDLKVDEIDDIVSDAVTDSSADPAVPKVEADDVDLSFGGNTPVFTDNKGHTTDFNITDTSENELTDEAALAMLNALIEGSELNIGEADDIIDEAGSILSSDVTDDVLSIGEAPVSLCIDTDSVANDTVDDSRDEVEDIDDEPEFEDDEDEDYEGNEVSDTDEELSDSEQPASSKRRRKKNAVPLNDFEASLRDFSEEDAEPQVKIQRSKFDIARVVILVMCVVICVISTSYLARNIYDKIRGEQIYGEIIDSVADGFNMDGNVANEGGKIDLLSGDKNIPYTPTMNEIIKSGITEIATPSDHSAELARMRASLESLRNINPDIYAWIKIPGTNINYPVAKTDNNEYYLDHAYTGEDLVNGSIYADYRCSSPLTSNYNTVLYGHNITTGSMFNHVSKFFDEDVFRNTLIYVYTFDGIYVFKPFSIHEAGFDSGFVDMGFSEEEFVAFANDMQADSDIASDVVFTPNDRLLTLSTCTNGIASKRYALHAVLTEAITD